MTILVGFHMLQPIHHDIHLFSWILESLPGCILGCGNQRGPALFPEILPQCLAKRMKTSRIGVPSHTFCSKGSTLCQFNLKIHDSFDSFRLFHWEWWRNFLFGWILVHHGHWNSTSKDWSDTTTVTGFIACKSCIPLVMTIVFFSRPVILPW